MHASAKSCGSRDGASGEPKPSVSNKSSVPPSRAGSHEGAGTARAHKPFVQLDRAALVRKHASEPSKSLSRLDLPVRASGRRWQGLQY